MKNRQSQKGFTIIELVVVILLLGILTATALPRFMDVTSQAHDAVVDGVLGGMNTGVALVRATWFAEGRNTTVANFGLGGVGVNTSGYPTGNAGAAPSSNTDCQTVYTDILQAGGRPSIGVMSIAGTNPATSDVTGAGYADDFLAGHSATTCFYVYTGEGATVSSPLLVYDTTTGTILLSSGEL